MKKALMLGFVLTVAISAVVVKTIIDRPCEGAGCITAQEAKTPCEGANCLTAD